MKCSRAGLLMAILLAAHASAVLAKAREAAPKGTVVFRIEGVLTKKSRKGKKQKRVLLPAFVKASLKPGDEVRTRARSRAEIHLGDGILVRLKENTVFKVERLKEKKGVLNVSLRLLAGKILLKVAKGLRAGYLVKVHTPTAVAAVRGTMFVVDAQAAKTGVKVLEGTVRAATVSEDAANPEEAGRDVEAGQQVAAAQGQPLSEPEPMSAEETAQESTWAQEPEMVVETSAEDESVPETEPGAAPEAGDESEPSVIEPEPDPSEAPEVQQDQSPETGPQAE
jgi:hypothetical protein